MRKFLKVEYHIIFSQYFGNFTQDFLLCDLVTAFAMFKKILVEFSKVFNFAKSLIYALPKFN